MALGASVGHTEIGNSPVPDVVPGSGVSRITHVGLTRSLAGLHPTAPQGTRSSAHRGSGASPATGALGYRDPPCHEVRVRRAFGRSNLRRWRCLDPTSWPFSTMATASSSREWRRALVGFESSRGFQRFYATVPPPGLHQRLLV